jgi:hypothetical protein
MQKTTRFLESRIYPICCTSAYCGNYGESCNGCENKPALDEFRSWAKRTRAKRVHPDSLVYYAIR